MVPQPGHGVPGFMISRKRVGAGGGMRVLGNNLASREPWDDANMCKKTGARDLENSAAPYSNFDTMCNNHPECCTTEFGVNIHGTSPHCEGKEIGGQSMEHVIDIMRDLPPEIHTYEVRNLIEDGSGNEFSNSIHVMKMDDDNDEIPYGMHVEDVVSPGDDDEPDIGYEEVYSLLQEAEPNVPQDSGVVSQKSIDDHETTIRGVPDEETEFYGEALEDQILEFIPHIEVVNRFDTGSPMQENDEIGFRFFPSSAQDVLQSGTGSSSRSTNNEHEFLSLSSSAQESSQGASEGFFRQAENDSLHLLSSPDEESWHSASTSVHNGEILRPFQRIESEGGRK